MPSLSRRALLPAALLLSLALAPAAAQATTVACNAIPQIDDGSGGVWWSSGVAGSASAKQYGELEIAVTTGVATSSDAYDTYGALFVGTTRYDAGAANCEETLSGGTTTVRYPEVVATNGLMVRRSLTFRLINAGAGHVLHLVTQNNIVRNPTGAAIVSDIAVGDSTGTSGSLGSDAAPPSTTTNTLLTSSGDASTTTGDDWAITGDATAGSPGNDPVLFHGWGQTYGGGDRPEEVGGGTSVDDWHTKWSAVSVPAGGTASFQTVEGVSLTDPKAVTTERDDLQAYSSVMTSQTYFFGGASLTATDIGASRNVPVPQPGINTPAPDRAAVGEPVQLVLDTYNQNNVAQCVLVSQSLTYDGTEVLSANGRTSPAGVAGTHPYTAVAFNSCGQATSVTGSVVVDGTKTTCAHTLSDGDGSPLFDGGGALFDVESDGSLSDGGFLTPIVGDSYDDADALTVNGTSFNPGTSGGCVLDAGGRQLRSTSQTIGGLDVSRSTYVASGGPGARLAFSLHNGTGAAITVPVLVGDSGDLGSDTNTNVVTTGNGTASVTPAARWMVTDDEDGGGDPSLAHVWDGAGGADGADVVTLDDPGDPSVGTDDYEVTYNGVTIAPGATATYVLWEGQRIRNPRALGERDDAVATARTLSGLAGADLYGGMTAAEIASVRNWAHPAPAGTLSGPATGTVGTPQTFTLAGLAGAAGLPQCGAGAVAWSVDGAAVAGGASITPSFAALGAHTVTATITGDCGGGSTVRTATFTASAAPVVTPPPVATVKVSGLKLVGGCLTAPKRKVTIKAGATVAVATKATLKIQRLVGRAKTCVKATSKAGIKLLKTKGAKTILTKSGKVVKGKAAFTVAARTVKTGRPKLVKGVLTLPRGAYRVVISAGTKTVATLLIVR